VVLYWENQLEKIKDRDFKSTFKVERDPKIKIKLLTLHHFQGGKSFQELAELVLADERTIKVWIDSFCDFDYEGLIEKTGRGRNPRLPPTEEESFKDALLEVQQARQGGRTTASEIQDLLSEKFDCCYSLSGVYSLLDRLNLVWISGRSQHPKSSLEAMEQFKAIFPEEMNKIQQQVGSNKIEVWWQDESRIGQQGSLSRVWATKGTRPRVVRQRQFLSTYIFGAVCPDRDIGCALVLPQCNSGMMQMHLDQISKEVAEGFHAIILMDRASWHTTETLNIPANITLMPLPPYSPELNPMEQVWQQLRKIKLSNSNYKDYESIVQSCCDAWNTFCDEEGNIQNLCTRNWAKS
jgi:transposase